MRSVLTNDAPAPIGPYSQAITSAGLVFCSGQIPLDPVTGTLLEGDAAAQTQLVLANLAAVLMAAGSSVDRVVKTTIYLTAMSDFSAVNTEYERVFGTAKPARSTVGVAELPRGARVEIDAIAITETD